MTTTTPKRLHETAGARHELPEHEGLVASARHELRQSPYPPLRQLQCEWEDRRLVLSGAVRSYFLKQMAQTLVARLSPGVPVENRVEVTP